MLIFKSLSEMNSAFTRFFALLCCMMKPTPCTALFSLHFYSNLCKISFDVHIIVSTQQKLPTTTLKFLHALLPNSYITPQTLFLVNLNPHLFHPSHLPQAFADFFSNKIATILHSLDIDSTSSPTCNNPQFLGQPLAAFHPVSEATVKDIIRQSSIKT